MTMSNDDLPVSTRVIYSTFDFVGRNKVQLFALTLAATLIGVLASGFYVVKKESEGLRTRFGEVVEEGIQPGVRYRIPVVEEAHVRQVKRIARYEIGSMRENTVFFTILSGDTNLLEVDVAIQYRISELRNFLFAAREPEEVLRIIVREGLVEGMGSNFIDLIFTNNRKNIEEDLFESTVEHLEEFSIGIGLDSLSIVDVRPIEETIAAFRDVNDAIAERSKAESDAHARSERFLARTRGQAEALVINARARANERIQQAQSAAQTFKALLNEYQARPEHVSITRYWQRMRTTFADANLAAVNPGDVSTIDVNMIDGIGAMPMHLGGVASLQTSGAGTTAERTLSTSTAVRDLHVNQDVELEQLTMDGRFHNRQAERDHANLSNPRSLIFDSPSIFAHRHVRKDGPVDDTQTTQEPLIKKIGSEQATDLHSEESTANE